MKKIISIVVATLFIGGVTFAQKKLDRSIKPKAGAAPVIKLGKTQSFTLENGLKVFVVENHKLPKVSFSLSLDVDPVLEGEMVGFKSATGELLGTKTQNRTKDQINEQVDFIGADLKPYADGIYASSLKKHQEKLLDLMSDVLMNAVFTQEELDKIKKQTISGIQSSKDNPDAIAGNVASALLYGKNHPYGEISTEKTVENITLEKCVDYYKTYFRPNVSYLAVVGDITLEEAKPLVEKYFAKWEKAEVPVNKFKTPMAPEKTTVAFVHKEGSTQSLINITYPISLKQNNPDVIKVKMLNSILGGGMTGRLFMNLREGHGYTYGAYSSINPDELVGRFNASAKVRNEVTDSAIIQFMVELRRIATEKVSEQELQDIKSYLTGTFAYSLQDPQTIANFALNIAKYKLPEDYYTTYLQKLNAVTVDDIKAVAEKYIKPDNAVILIIGDKAVAEKVKSFSADGKVSFYDNYGNDYVEALKQAPAGVTAQTVLDNAIKAKYGLPKGKALDKKLSKIKDLTVKMNASIQGQTIGVTRYQKAPNKFAMVMAMGTMVIQKQTFDGTVGKVSGMQGNKDVEGADLDDLKASSEMFAELNYEKHGIKHTLLGIEPLDGKEAYKMEKLSASGEKETVWYDVASGLQVKTMSVQTNEDMGGEFVVMGLYSDYKEVNGIKFAHKIKQSFGPQVLDMEVTSVEVNTKLGDEVFK
ncbi:MAG: insulinase family protein [Flavobacteriales bacterium]|nr:insulinase family protein [Flavobacteriales bacterium]MCB9174397.1 insulinase family protein [Flavobacteriales bacterium]